MWLHLKSVICKVIGKPIMSLLNKYIASVLLCCNPLYMRKHIWYIFPMSQIARHRAFQVQVCFMLRLWRWIWSRCAFQCFFNFILFWLLSEIHLSNELRGWIRLGLFWRRVSFRPRHHDQCKSGKVKYFSKYCQLVTGLTCKTFWRIKQC